MAARALDRTASAAARGAATHLVVLCHGYGADGNDLIGLAPHWQRLCRRSPSSRPMRPSPAPRVRAINGFRSRGSTRARCIRAWNMPAASLEAFLDAELARADLPPDRLALVGFSQGTMMSLHVGLETKARRDRRLFGAARRCPAGALSGCAAGPARAWRCRPHDPAWTLSSRPRPRSARGRCRPVARVARHAARASTPQGWRSAGSSSASRSAGF